MKLFAEVKFISEIAEEKKVEPCEFYILRFTKIEQLAKNLSIIGSFSCGSLQTRTEEFPGDALFYLGGFPIPEKGLLPFIGFEFMSIVARNVSVFAAGLQYEPWKGKFITINGNFAKVGEQFSDLYKENYDYKGFGITFGIKTQIGPMKFSLMKGQMMICKYLMTTAQSMAPRPCPPTAAAGRGARRGAFLPNKAIFGRAMPAERSFRSVGESGASVGR